jgi:predicted DNA-binding transcriptional regulator AlpA
MNDRLIKVTEAQKLLGVSKKKMASLLAEGTLPYTLDPLDKRVKLVDRSHVEQLMEHRLRKAA